MTRRRRGSLWAPRVLSLLASAWVHLAGVSVGLVIWPLFLLLCLMGGSPAEHPYAFRWNNAYFNGTDSPDEGLIGEDWIVLVPPPRRARVIPEFEKPRVRESLDPRKLRFDENLGPPSPLETPFPGPEGSGFVKAKGESLDFVSDKPFRGKGTYDSLGAAGGGGGRYGSAVVLMDAVQWGLLWVARHQKGDGSWTEGPPRDRCGRPLPGGRAISGPACGREDESAPRDPIRDTAFAVLAFNVLLNEMDGLQLDSDVFFILTTNRPESLEMALASRPGRIDQAIEYPLPDDECRAKLVRLYSQGLTLPGGMIARTVGRTRGVSASFIRELMRRSAQFHLERGGESGEITDSDIDAALDELLVSGGRLNRKLLGADGSNFAT